MGGGGRWTGADGWKRKMGTALECATGSWVGTPIWHRTPITDGDPTWYKLSLVINQRSAASVEGEMVKS